VKTNTRFEEIKLTHPAAPLIDVVFLLLIYFMVTSSLIWKEGDIAFQLPGPNIKPALDVAVDAYIRIETDGGISIEGIHFDKSDQQLQGLVHRIAALRQMAESQHSRFSVTLHPDDATVHSRVIEVLNACAAAKVKNITFARRDA
jgi:biopolymer transport protein ExbD